MRSDRREREPPGTKSQKAAVTKLFVLDTNVLMHDPTSLFRFEEHDVFIPMVSSRSWTTTRRA